MKTISSKKQKIIDVLSVLLIVIAVHFVVGAFNGKWPWSPNPYNSYLLQAKAWLDGHLDLGYNIEYLELAIYQDKYFVSFPPLPSYILLPFAYLYGDNVPEGWIAFFIMLLGAFYALRIAWHFLGTGAKAVFWTCFLYLGTNVLYDTLDAGVWFIAQSCALTFSLLAIFYALKGKGGHSLFFWGCAIGCRPLQVIYFPILVYLLYRNLKEKEPEKNFLQMVKSRFYWAFPVLLVALSYMILNYARFGNVAEFGHTYLPEFNRGDTRQFKFSYITQNIPTLFRLPEKQENGTLHFYAFNGNNIFLISPLFVSYLIYLARTIFTRKKVDWILFLSTPVLVIVHIIALCSHETMGGFHFGHRYINDCLPFVYFLTLMLAYGKPLFKPLVKLVKTDTSKDCVADSNEEIANATSETSVTEDISESNDTNILSDTSVEEQAEFLVTEPEQETAEDCTYFLHYALCALGMGINLVGSIATNMTWVS